MGRTSFLVDKKIFYKESSLVAYLIRRTTIAPLQIEKHDRTGYTNVTYTILQKHKQKLKKAKSYSHYK